MLMQCITSNEVFFVRVISLLFAAEAASKGNSILIWNY